MKGLHPAHNNIPACGSQKNFTDNFSRPQLGNKQRFALLFGGRLDPAKGGCGIAAEVLQTGQAARRNPKQGAQKPGAANGPLKGRRGPRDGNWSGLVAHGGEGGLFFLTTIQRPTGKRRRRGPRPERLAGLKIFSK